MSEEFCQFSKKKTEEVTESIPQILLICASKWLDFGFESLTFN